MNVPCHTRCAIIPYPLWFLVNMDPLNKDAQLTWIKSCSLKVIIWSVHTVARCMFLYLVVRSLNWMCIRFSNYRHSFIYCQHSFFLQYYFETFLPLSMPTMQHHLWPQWHHMAWTCRCVVNPNASSLLILAMHHAKYPRFCTPLKNTIMFRRALCCQLSNCFHKRHHLRGSSYWSYRALNKPIIGTKLEYVPRIHKKHSRKIMMYMEMSPQS